MKKNTGITLVALVITVIVMLLLAGVAISAIVGTDGLLNKIIKSAETYNNSALNEVNTIENMLDNNFLNGGDSGPIEIPDLTEENITFSYTPSNWTNGVVEVGITTTIEGYKLQYSLDSGENWNNYTNKLQIQENNKIVLVRLEKSGNISNIATGNVKNIDKLPPKEFIINASNITKSEFTINAITEDMEETEVNGNSGIKNYIYYIKKLSEEIYTSNIIFENSYVYLNLEPETEYNVYVAACDNAGNIKNSNIITIKTEKREVPATEESELGNYVKYNGVGYANWRVLYNDGNNISLISVGAVENKYFYGTSAYTNCVSQLNSIASKYNDGIYCESVRSVNKDDYYPMKAIGANSIGSHYWLSNNYYTEVPYMFPPNITGMMPVYSVCFITSNGVPGGALNTTIIDGVESSLGQGGAAVNYWGTEYGFTFGVRVVVKLKSNVKIESGTGSSSDPYILTI